MISESYEAQWAFFQWRTTMAGDLFSVGLRSMHRATSHLSTVQTTELSSRPSTYIPGLKITTADSCDDPIGDGLVVGTMRMGYGHYRFALSLVDSALAQGHTPFWHDLSGMPISRSKILDHVNRF